MSREDDIRDRHRGGDTVADLAMDYALPEPVIAGIVEAIRNRAAGRVLVEHWRATQQ